MCHTATGGISIKKYVISIYSVEIWDLLQVSEMYSWNDVARRTADVYKKVMDTPDMTLKQRIRLMHTTGPALGKVAIGQLLPMRVD